MKNKHKQNHTQSKQVWLKAKKDEVGIKVNIFTPGQFFNMRRASKICRADVVWSNI
jgi:hypothetical protein